jgi:hypothetical protein
MEIDFFRSPLTFPALACCVAVSINLLRKEKNLGSLLIMLGFVAVTTTQLGINYCIGLAVLDVGIDGYPVLCSSIPPYINGAGFMAIGVGLYRLVQGANNGITSASNSRSKLRRTG